MADLTSGQKAAIKAAVNADPALVTAWAAAATSAVANALNLSDQAGGDIDAAREGILRALVGRSMLGKIYARIDVLNSRVQAALILSAAADVSTFETALQKIHNARLVFELLPSLTMTDGPTRVFIGNMLDALITEGVAVAADKTAISNLGKGTVSRSFIACGRSISEGELVASMI